MYSVQDPIPFLHSFGCRCSSISGALMLTVLMFSFGTSESQLGNALQAVAQVVKPGTVPVLEYAVNGTDREVEQVC